MSTPEEQEIYIHPSSAQYQYHTTIETSSAKMKLVNLHEYFKKVSCFQSVELTLKALQRVVNYNSMSKPCFKGMES